MSELLKKALALISINSTSTQDSSPRPLQKLTERELINLESAIGSKLFGEVPSGHRREFFCLDRKTWIWHEEWVDAKRVRQQSTTRYEIHDNGILKVQAGPRYEYIQGQELENLALAVKMYHEQVARGVYKVDPDTGTKLT
jgi:hypothetical protein